MNKIFISYSHQDKEWESKLAKQLNVLALEGFCDVWDDTRIQIGKDWKHEIENALNEASIAILMISVDFLTSGFIREEEIPTIMQRRENEGLTVIPVFVKPCAWRKIPWLSKIQGIPSGNKTLFELPTSQADKILANLAEQIHDMLLDNEDENENKKPPTIEKKIKKPHYDTELLTPLPPRTVHLIGREQDLKFLEKRLQETDRVLLMNGLGGIGKTELCKRYFYDHYNEYAYAAWIDYNISIKESFVRSLGKKDAQGSVDEQFAVLMYQLMKYKDPFLMVIDNIENPEDEGLIEVSRLPESYKIIATSRNNIEGYECHTLEYLSPECCRDLFYEHFKGIKNQENDKTVDEIVQLCGFHTLTVELVAKTGHNAALSVKKLYVILKDKGFNLGEVIDNEVKIQWHKVKDKKPLFEHLLKVFELTGESSVTESELNVLANLSVLPAQYIPIQTLCEWMNLETPNDIVNLVEKGWLRRDKEDRVFMHQVIQEVIRYKTEPDVEECKDLIDSLGWKLHLEPTENPMDKKEFVVFADAIIIYVKGEDENLAALANNLSAHYKIFGQLDRALEFQLKAIKICESVLGFEHPNLASSYNNVSMIYQDMGQLDQALGFQLKALEIKKKVLDPEHPDLAASYNNLSMIHKDMGQLDRALEFQLKDLEIKEKVLGPDHPDLATSYNNVSLIYKDMGQLDRALEFQFKALEIREKVLGPDHPSLATSYNNLSQIYQDMGQLDRALELQLNTVRIEEKVLGPDHPSLATSYNNMCTLYYSTGQLNQALEFQLKALSIREKILGPDHPDLAQSYNNLCTLYYSMGQLDRALEFQLKAMGIYEKVLGQNHPLLATSFHNLSYIFREMNNLPTALEYAEKAIAILEKIFPNGHPNLDIMKENLEIIREMMKG